MRSDCPVSFALDFIGDKWTFLVIRDLVEGKRFYKEFLAGKEGIATNILSDRLKKLEANGFVESSVYEKLRTQKVYALTQKGKDLIPAMFELMMWSAKYEPSVTLPEGFVKNMTADREGVIDRVRASLD